MWDCIWSVLYWNDKKCGFRNQSIWYQTEMMDGKMLMTAASASMPMYSCATHQSYTLACTCSWHVLPGQRGWTPLPSLHHSANQARLLSFHAKLGKTPIRVRFFPLCIKSLYTVPANANPLSTGRKFGHITPKAPIKNLRIWTIWLSNFHFSEKGPIQLWGSFLKVWILYSIHCISLKVFILRPRFPCDNCLKILMTVATVNTVYYTPLVSKVANFPGAKDLRS